MSDKITRDIDITDFLLRISAIEKVLKDKGIVTEEEIVDTIKTISESLAKSIIDSSLKTSGGIDELISSLSPVEDKKKFN